MRWEQKIQFATLSDPGLRRQNNEDSFATRLCTTGAEFAEHGHLFLVADGMGGHAVGELASKMAAEILPHLYFKQTDADPRLALQKSIIEVNEQIHARGEQNREFQRMGTTCSSLVLSPGGAYVVHVGDSRVYRVRRDRVDQLTSDHSLEWELQERNKGKGKAADFSMHRNVITRSLGPESKVMADLEGPYHVLPGDQFLLCSDGLSNQVSDEEIGAIIRELSPSQACHLLVNLSNARGGPDNCTAVVLKIGDLPANVALPEIEVPRAPQHPWHWLWLLGIWIAGLILVLGFALMTFNRTVPGLVLMSTGLLGLLGLSIVGFKMLRGMPANESFTESMTNLSRPYRTAVCQSSTDLFTTLKDIEAELRRAAQEDGWDVNWDNHREAMKAAGSAQQEKRFGRGCRDLSRAIDHLMSQLPQAHRRSRDSKPAEDA